MNYQRKLVLLIVISTTLRIVLASSLELANTEVYYWVLSQHLQWNYFDHPPIVAGLIRLTTVNHLLHGEVFVRLGAIISSAICTWLFFKIGTRINNQQTGWYAALLYTASIYGSIETGTFIEPDGPQMVFWLTCILLLIKIFHTISNDRKYFFLWCLFGVVSGLCIMSKVHGIFLWIGVVFYALLFNRGWLKHPAIYISGIITLIIISPIFIWNFQNDFATYKFHSERVSLIGAELQLGEFLKELLAAAVIANPINFFLICSSLVWVFRAKIPVDKKLIHLIMFCCLPLIIVLLFVSLFRVTLPHWPGPAYTCLCIIPAIRLATDIKSNRRLIPNILVVSLAFMLIMAAGQVLITNYYPGTLSEQKQDLNMGTGDFTLDMYGWEEAGKRFDSLYRSDVAGKIMPPGCPIVITKWFPAAHIDYYFATKTKQETIGMGEIKNLHQYYWINQYKKALKNGDNAYYIVPSNLFDYKMLDEVNNSFDRFEMPLTIVQYRGGVVCRQVYIFRLRGYKKY